MQLRCVVAVLSAICAVHGFCDAPPTLKTPTVADGQLQFTLTGENDTPYRIDASTNLQTWFPVATNLDFGSPRQIRVPIVGPRAVYRAFARTPLFNFALLARDTIDLNGNNVLIDSFDSEDPNLSTNGQYDPLKRSARGDIASSYSLPSPSVLIDVGNASIYGTALTTTNGRVDIGPNGKVGDLSWHADTTSSGIQPGAARDDLRVHLPEVTAPFRVGVPPMSGVYGAAFHTYKLASDNYSMNILVLRSNQTMIVTGNASLYVASQLSLSDSSKLIIVEGATLRLYAAATNITFNGDSICNSNPASAFVVYSVPGNTNITLSGPERLTGCIYAPNAACLISGGGTSQVSVAGSIIARRITVTGNPQIHYDEALSRSGTFTW